ncbi:MAG: fimbrillin family protein [Bacteroidales bacterium]|nr:fimbrillin family protein [Bacteroidales bacterium]
MRKKLFYLCAALFALSSCTNEIIEEGFVDKSNAISFNSSAPKTRAYTDGDVDNTTKLQEGNFGVVGYSNDALYLGATGKAAEQTYDAGNWKYVNDGEIRYWPNNNMDFYAYFPFSATGDVFANSKPADNGTPVMTITNNSGNQDVLFASTLNQPRVNRVDMQFHHAFSKIQGIEIQIQNKDVTVEVQKIEVINTSTKGEVLVDKDGYASYGANNTTRVFDFTGSPVTITKASTFGINADQFETLVEGSDNGYIFATNNATTNYVSGTHKTLWDGTKTGLTGGTTLETLEQVCLKLTCKVTTPKTGGTNYHVGSDGSYGVMYIPISGSSITGIDPADANRTALLAGKRYTYKIVMENNVGFDENGNAILLPILFKSTSVDSWDDVTVTITL